MSPAKNAPSAPARQALNPSAVVRSTGLPKMSAIAGLAVMLSWRICWLCGSGNTQSSIILITGAGGIFGGVLRASGIGQALTERRTRYARPPHRCTSPPARGAHAGPHEHCAVDRADLRW